MKMKMKMGYREWFEMELKNALILLISCFSLSIIFLSATLSL